MHGTQLSIVSILVSIIGVEVAETDISLLRYPSFFEVWNSSLENALSYYSYNKWPRLHPFNLRRCMPCQGC